MWACSAAEKWQTKIRSRAFSSSLLLQQGSSRAAAPRTLGSWRNRIHQTSRIDGPESVSAFRAFQRCSSRRPTESPFCSPGHPMGPPLRTIFKTFYFNLIEFPWRRGSLGTLILILRPPCLKIWNLVLILYFRSTFKDWDKIWCRMWRAPLLYSCISLLEIVRDIISALLLRVGGTLCLLLGVGGNLCLIHRCKDPPVLEE
jgi:hypothetical protein